ncbi:hypothetical protein [Pararhizobium sp. PWRC1-1]|uniref:hypothetical protein n=1 Tax=Pararhizobium sp. PWRC1-1 TaxID=2804566 RepID=UPI003CF541ED
MMLDLIHVVLLSLAIGLSWVGCAKIFSSETNHGDLLSPRLTIAAAVNLSAIGLSFAQSDMGLAISTVVLGLVLAASTAKTLNPILGLPVSVASLSLYLHLNPL